MTWRLVDRETIRQAGWQAGRRDGKETGRREQGEWWTERLGDADRKTDAQKAEHVLISTASTVREHFQQKRDINLCQPRPNL